MYAYISNNIVVQLIPDFDPVFPEVPIEQRYSDAFCKKLVHINDDSNVSIGMVYNSDTKEFCFPVINHLPTIIDESKSLDELKKNRISESKKMLSEWLESHPYLYSDGKYYACTEEKQALLNGNLASYERATKAGIEYPLKWNSTGDECVAWEYSDLMTLSLSIAEYVAPKVSMQQAYELQIKACKTIEEVNEIVINYD